MRLEEDKIKEFFKIIKDHEIKTVFQPIVALDTGEVYAYEALSRITLKQSTLTIDKLFDMADQLEQVWNLEKLCRKKALKAATKKPKHAKLFLNVDPNVMLDQKFYHGFTREFVEKYKLKTSEIVFELTERTSVEDRELFKNTVRHYKEQGFGIAIDDVGSGYSGLNRINCVEPKYIKIDMELIRDIHLNKPKFSMVQVMAKFCKEMNYILIAEGIENEEELKVLIQLGVPYGQGYYFRKPEEEFLNVPKPVRQTVRELWESQMQCPAATSLLGTVEAICKTGLTMSPETKAVDAYSLFKKDEEILEICVVDAQGNFQGILTRHAILKDFGGMYGYTLHQKYTVSDIMKKDTLVVNVDFSVESVAKMAMERNSSEIYDAVVVLKYRKYHGMVTIKDLLTTTVEIQVKRAKEVNPLSSLPGNVVIEEQIRSLVGEEKPFAIMYLDLDNFKAYNDAYGFNHGDRMIKAVVDSMQYACDERDFLGHIGGDDFVIITRREEPKRLGQCIVEQFQSYLPKLYNDMDWERGFIVSTNRHGLTEQFPIASLSVAVVTNHNEIYRDMGALSEKIVQTKKAAKKQPGNSVVEL